MNAVAKTNPADVARATAANRLVSAAQMDLHQLVDEYKRLTEFMDQNIAENEQGYPRLNDAGELAHRERKMIVGAARARFGIGFESYDRPSQGASSDDW